MTPKRTAGRLLSAVSLGLASVASIAACTTGAVPAGSAQTAWTAAPEADSEARRAPEKALSSPPPSTDAGPPSASSDAPRCPYGALEDAHRGFVRCLLPEERDAGWLPPPQADGRPAEPPRAEPPPDAGPSGPLPSVEIGAPKFENGEVTKVEKSLGKASGDIARCVADHGGLGAETGTLKVQFLVRSRGRAEGVEIVSAKGVSAEASACIRHLLKNKAIGAPTADPVGVSVVLTFKPGR